VRKPVWEKAHWHTRVLPWCKYNWILLVLFGSCVFAICLTGWLVYHEHRPPVGVYIAIMGLIGAAMAARKEPSGLEKALWIVLITILMVAEIRNIYITDREQAGTFSKISQDLDTTKVGLQATQTGIEAAARKIGQTATGIQTLDSEITGGDSYMYLDISFIGGPIEMDAGGLKKGMMIGGTFPKFVGEYPLHNVYLSEYGPLGHGNEIDYGTIFPNEIGRPRAYPEIYFYPDKPKQMFFFFISTSNGSYSEVMLVKKIGDKWLWACRFSKYGRKKPIRQWAVPGFPKDQLNADWDKLE
jgi:hypothetical protein